MHKLKSMGKTALFVSSFLWGMGYVAVELALQSGWHPVAILAVTGLIGAMVLIVFSKKRNFFYDKDLMKEGIIAGVFLSAGMILQIFGQLMSTPSKAAIIITSYVIFTPILYSIKQRRPLTRLVFVASTLAFMGVVIISYDGGFSFLIGDVILVLGALMFAFHFIQLEKNAKFDDAISLSIIQLLTMSILMSCVLPFLSYNFAFNGFIYVAYLGVVSSGLAFFLQNYGQKLVTSSSASVIMTFEAIFGVVASILVFQSVLSFKLFIGAFLLLGSVFMLELMPHSRYFKGRRYKSRKG